MSSDAVAQAGITIGLEVSDPSELRALREHLRRLPEIRVEQVPRGPNPGEQGAGDGLQIFSVVAVPSLAVAIRTLPEFIRSRRSRIRITLTRPDREITLELDNEASESDVQALVDKLLRDA